MSFLRKRSRSQCSFRNGDEETSVCRKESQDIARISKETINSARSSCSDVEAPDFSDSCVARKVKHKSSHLRFLTWVAYTRVYDEEITEDERKTCPLLWCRTVFKDQESMLQHVWNCQHLSKGLYWCFHCQKPERVGKFECKRCQGLPTRVDRVASVARRIFSKLGAKPHRHEQPSSAAAQTDKTLDDVAEALELSKLVSYPNEKSAFVEAGPVNWIQQDAQELPNTFIIPELDSTLATATDAFPYPNMPEMMGSEPPTELGNGTEWTDNFYAENWDDVDVPQAQVPKPRWKSPKLAIDTSVISAIPETYEKQVPTYQSDWTITPDTDIVSPLSPSGGSKQFATLDLSPTDSIASGKSFFSDSGYSSASWTFSANGSLSRNSSVESRKGKEKALDQIPEEWTHEPLCAHPVALPSPPNVQSLSRNSSNASHSASRCTENPTTPAKSSTSIVKSFSDVLDEGIKHTKLRLQEMPASPIVSELLTMSRTSMVSIGLDVLAGILEGRGPGSISQVFAFAHVACAASIAIYGEEAQVHTQTWFSDSLAWVPERQRPMYLQIAKSIWEPFGYSGLAEPALVPVTPARRNSVLSACQHFLNVFEHSRIQEDNAISTTERRFNFAQSAFERNAKILVIDELIKKPCIEAFIEDVVQVEKSLLQGYITCVRGLELELVCAGKLASQSDSAYERFQEQVTQLCSALYDPTTTQSSTAHYIRDVSLIKELMPEENDNEIINGNQTTVEVTTVNESSFPNIASDDGDILDGFDFDLFEQDANDALLNDENLEALFPTSSLSNGGVYQYQPSEQHLIVPQQQHQQLMPPQNLVVPQPKQQQLMAPSPFSPTSTASQFSSNISTPFPSHSPTPHPPTTLFYPLALLPTSRQPSTPPLHQAPSQPSKASQVNYTCRICGHIPTGEDKWKASNLRRHKRTQHPVEAKTYPCPFLGCESTFSRSDNLRDHQRRKGHEVRGLGRGGVGVVRNGSSSTARPQQQISEEAGGVDGAMSRDGVGNGSGSFKRRKLASGEGAEGS